MGVQIAGQNRGKRQDAALCFGNMTNQGNLVSGLILRGAQAMKDKTAEIAGDSFVFKGWKEEIATEIRGAYSDARVEQSAIDAAFLIAAARSVMGQPDDIGAAVTLATGGIVQHDAAGAKIPLPWGMKDDGTFDRRIAALTPANFSGQVPDGVVHVGAATMPLQKFVSGLHDATLVHAGQGQYCVRAGTTLATHAQGQDHALTATAGHSLLRPWSPTSHRSRSCPCRAPKVSRRRCSGTGSGLLRGSPGTCSRVVRVLLGRGAAQQSSALRLGIRSSCIGPLELLRRA